MQMANYSSSSGDASGFTPITPSRRRRQIQGSACDDCRRRKARCDGQRPICGSCERNAVPWRVPVHTTTPPRRSKVVTNGHIAARHMLTCARRSNSRFETDVGETRTAARSRKTNDLKYENEHLRLENDELRRQLVVDAARFDSLAASSVSAPPSPLDLTPSFHATDQAALPSWLTSMEYELMLSHPNSYAFQQLPDLATLLSLHTKRARRMLGDVHFAAEEASIQNRSGAGEAVQRGQGLEEPPQSSEHFLHHELSWQHPQSGSAPSHSDPRLENVDIGAWCSVAMPDEIAGRLIGFYLEMDHPVLGHFDADLFVEDLIHFRTEFCSSLLVNSLLLWACHGYSAFDERAFMLKDALFTETKRLWNQHRGIDSILTLAAGIFLKVACVCNGDEKLGRTIMIDVYEMAHRLDLFGNVDDMPAYTTGGNDDSNTQWLRARAHVAWGVFNFVTLNAFSYGEPVMRLPPKFAIPGDTDTWQLPDYMGTTFTRLCELWLIVNQVAVLYYAEPLRGSISQRTSLEFAQRTYGRLLQWTDAHGPLIRNWASDSHHQSYLHTVFHAAVLDIFRPFLGLNLPLQSFGEQQYTPESIFIASVHQINYQVLIYPVVHPSTTFIFWFSALIQSANAAMTTLQDPGSRQMFLVCLLALQDLSPCFPILSTALRGLLSIATRKGDIDKKNARQLHDRLSKHHGLSERASEAGGAFVIDLAAALGEPTMTAGQLAESFEGIMLSGTSE